MFQIIISTCIMVPFVFYIWNDWAKEKFKWKSFKTFIVLIFTIFLAVVNYLTINPLIRIINMTLIFIVSYKNLYKTHLNKSIVSPVTIEILYVISESIFAAIMMGILKNGANDFVSNYFGTLFTNLSISIIVFILSKIKFIRNLLNYFNSLTETIDKITLIFLLCLTLFIYAIFAVNSYYRLSSALLMLFSLIIVLISFILLFIFFKTKDDYYKVSDKYNSSLLSLRELEKVLTNYRIDNHENKNQLMTIRNMTTSKKITKFIDSILDNNLKDDKKIMKETSIIPAGGLRGLIYSKLLLMSSKNIEYELDVSNSVRVVDILDYGDDTMLDICKIVGIFLDNAIEEVDTIDDKYIVVEMFKDEESFKISITNTFDNTKDKKDIYKAGVSSKGGNHGYGLSLVKKLVKNNDKLDTHYEVSDDEFTQILNVYK